MAKLVNQVTISGYVATEPKVFGKDRNVGRIRIRYDRSRKVQDEWKKEANFFGIVVFGDAVDRLLELQKGDKVLVVGRLQQQQTEDKKEFVDIVADEVVYIPRPEEDSRDNAGDNVGGSASQAAEDFLNVS